MTHEYIPVTFSAWYFVSVDIATAVAGSAPQLDVLGRNTELVIIPFGMDQPAAGIQSTDVQPCYLWLTETACCGSRSPYA